MFLEFSTAFSFDFGRRRPEQIDLHELVDDHEDIDEPELAPQRPGVKLGFQRREPECDCEGCSSDR